MADELSGENQAAGNGNTHRVLQTGESFGNYRIIKCLAPGLIVNYYRAQHVRDLREVTLGIFHPRTLEDTRFLRRLVELKEVLESFDNEAVPKVLDCAQIDGLHCVFLEPVDGITLSAFFGKRTEVLEQPGGLMEEEVRDLLAKLLGILGVAHSHGIDHRDLDSNFILIQDDNSLKLLGLGVRAAVGVKVFEAIVSASVSPLASKQTAQRMTSIDVVSPEYQMGMTEDFRVDINGVGVVGYWLLTGRKPKRSDYAPPSQVNKALSPNWDKFIASCIARNLEDRYSSAKIALVGLGETHPQAAGEGDKSVRSEIERIPASKRRKRGGRGMPRAVRLGIIGALGTALIALASVFLVDAFTGAGRAEGVAVEVGSAAEANFRLDVNPSYAQIKIEDTGETFSTSEGRLFLKLERGSHRVTISAPNHVPVTLNVDRVAGEAAELTANLKPSWTDLQLRAEPGATVTAVDSEGREIELGRTDGSGILYLQKGIFAGVYDIIIEKEGFQRKVLGNREIRFGEVNDLEVRLVGEPASVLVRSAPEGATVLLDGMVRGTTPLRLEAVEAGIKHLVVVEMEGYRSVGRSVELETGEERVIDFGVLRPPAGEIVPVLGLSDGRPLGDPFLREVTVEIDGERMPYAGGSLGEIPAGSRTIRFLHPLYRSAPVQIDVRDREVTKLEVKMLPRPAYVELVVPPGAEVSAMLEGEPVPIEEGRVEIPSRQPVELALQVPDHLVMRRLLELGPNETFVWEVDPVPIPSPDGGKDWMVPYIGIEMVWVPAGTFVMGSPLAEVGRLPEEGPRTEVRFGYGFWMGAYEVTQTQFRRVMQQNPSLFPGSTRPVENLTWGEARSFCQLLTNVEEAAGRLPEGYAYRLPLEAEWEYAARAGTDTPFHWGSRADPSLGNFEGVYPKDPDRRDDAEPDHYGTLPVGTFQPNSLGLYDVHGNVREFTFDFYNGRHPGGAIRDPDPRRDGLSIATRGGSWKDTATLSRSASRDGIRANTRSNAVGFRVVLAPEFD